MAARWIALSIALVSLLIIGIFMRAVLWPPPPPMVTSGTEAAASGAKRIMRRGEVWTLTARIIPDSAGATTVSVSITDAEGRPVTPPTGPTAVLRMVDMAMGAQTVSLVQDAPGFWRGASRLSMSGRWSLEVDVEGESIHLPFEAAFR